MINAVGRDIPEEILELTGKEVFQGNHHFDGHVFQRHGAMTKCVINSNGKLKGLAIMRSHGGRVRALVTGETKIDIAFIGTPTYDEYGNCRGIGGKSDCGVLSYAMADAQYADHVVAITDCMVPFPNFPAHISMTNVDYVVAVDEIGDLAVPLTLMFDTDSFFFGLMPVLIEIAGNFGVLPAHIAIVMVVCRNCATFISPVVPATFLGIGLADVEIKDHIKNCFFWIWGVSIVCLLAGLLLGVIKI